MKKFVITSGVIYLMAFFQIAGAAAAGSVDNGKTIFDKKCKMCHALKAGAEAKMGSNLHGLVGRKAGSAEGFEFSAALKGSDIVWSNETLDAFLKKPRAFIPKNRMMFPGLRSADERADLIEYLDEATK